MKLLSRPDGKRDVEKDYFTAGPVQRLSSDHLIELVALSNKRDFCEEVDEIERIYKQSAKYSASFF